LLRVVSVDVKPESVMKKATATVLLLIYFSILAVNVLASIYESRILFTFTKPALMPLLMSYVANHETQHRAWKDLVFIVAMSFAWIGDGLLIISSIEPFYAGMAAFFSMHVLYSVVFWSLLDLSLWPVYTLLAVVYITAAILYSVLLHARLDSTLVVLISIYIGALVSMSVSATTLRFPGAFGALLFVLSDATLATNMFLKPSWMSGSGYTAAFIMLTYGIAQCLLCTAFTKHTSGRHTKLIIGFALQMP
jgi:uncharacterized membrane protein YhhN